MKTLIIGPSWVGDMVMSQSLYITLKEQQPDMELHVMAPRWCLPLLSRMPEVDHAIEMPLGHGDLNLRVRWKLGRMLKQQQYQQAIILPNSLKSALIPLFAGIPTRTGWKGESRYGLLNDLRRNKNAFPLMVERYLALAFPASQMRSSVDLQGIPFPTLRVNSQQQQQALTRLALSLEQPVLGLCPGAEFGPAKRWPEQHYAEIAQRWIAAGGQVWIFGSNKDQSVSSAIQKHLPAELQASCHLLAGKTSLEEAIDLLAACTKVVSNDSGLMHIAAAVKTPLVAVYGSTSPGYTPPLADKVQIVHTDIVCRPCFKRECPLGHLKCLKELPPDQVWQALNNLTDRV
ncbi:lipopolysaccharide heptosyltransferase II [Tolumonas lignilytica]|uniref:lipopolysaccharide heptosyltransferase II n=1 Tax=Tolumonas lignilytica TaxID=1283284 RepID=UPI000463B9D4|nr:lipopolysaccharide heptosyltransferase II [Tolumonas lignilytica]